MYDRPAAELVFNFTRNTVCGIRTCHTYMMNMIQETAKAEKGKHFIIIDRTDTIYHLIG
jgi:hypothetical protein